MKKLTKAIQKLDSAFHELRHAAAITDGRTKARSKKKRPSTKRSPPARTRRVVAAPAPAPARRRKRPTRKTTRKATRKTTRKRSTQK